MRSCTRHPAPRAKRTKARLDGGCSVGLHHTSMKFTVISLIPIAGTCLLIFPVAPDIITCCYEGGQSFRNVAYSAEHRHRQSAALAYRVDWPHPRIEHVPDPRECFEENPPRLASSRGRHRNVAVSGHHDHRQAKRASWVSLAWNSSPLYGQRMSIKCNPGLSQAGVKKVATAP